MLSNNIFNNSCMCYSCLTCLIPCKTKTNDGKLIKAIFIVGGVFIYLNGNKIKIQTYMFVVFFFFF